MRSLLVSLALLAATSVAHAQYLYVSSYNGNFVKRCNPFTGGDVETLITDANNLRGTHGLAIGQDGTLLVGPR